MSFLLPFLGGAIAGAAFGSFVGGRGGSVPPPVNYKIDIPDPIPPPNQPLDPSNTAALQKARIKARSGSSSTNNKDIVLTTPSIRQKEPEVVRTTLLGQ